MARGGFISPAAYLERAFERNISLDDAKRTAIEALSVGRLASRGRVPTSAIARLEAPDAGTLTKPESTKLEDIPSSAWAGLTDEVISRWEWMSGRFHGSGDFGWQPWESVKFNEAQSNDLLDRMQPPLTRNASASPTERRRGPTWDEWVAVVATLAFEHAIDETSTDRDIVQRAAMRLGMPEAQTKRMKAAALAIVSRWKELPPNPPPPHRVEFKGGTPKP